jgi:3-isopropylmalate/(R)-2-methylmalate dehydratase small subunit
MNKESVTSVTPQAAQTSSRVWRLGDQIDTDALAPGAYMKFGIDVIAKHTLESLRPEFASEVQAGDVIVAGEGFGVGSSREQAAGVLVHLGVKAVIAPSFSGLFYRNAFNLGLLLLTCTRADEIQEGMRVQVLSSGVQIEGGALLSVKPVPDFLLEMVRAKGLLNVLKARIASGQLHTRPQD